MDSITMIFMYGQYHEDPLRSNPTELGQASAGDAERASTTRSAKSRKRRGVILIKNVAESLWAESTMDNTEVGNDDGQVETKDAESTVVLMEEPTQDSQLAEGEKDSNQDETLVKQES